MKAATAPSFWAAYGNLKLETRRRARKAFQLWLRDPFHPSLHFKCINDAEGVWSARIDLSHRAIGVMEGDTVTWFWIGSHDEYEREFSR